MAAFKVADGSEERSDEERKSMEWREVVEGCTLQNYH